MARNSLEKGIAAAKAGNKLLARLHLLEAAERHPQEITCWLWLAWASDSPEDAVSALRKALGIDPDHELANAGMAWARGMGQLATSSEMGSPTTPSELAKVSPVGSARMGASPAALTPTGSPQVVVPPVAPKPWEFGSGESGGSAARGIPAAAAAAAPVPVPSGSSSGLRPVTPPASGAGLAVGSGSFPPVAAHAANGQGLGGSSSASVVSVAPPESGEADAARKPTILVVDDSQTVRKLVSITLKGRGYDVLEANDGIAALDVISNRKPDLILLDITMPRLDGYKLCKIIKGHDETRHIPVIMLSGKDGFFDKARGKFVGCTSYITKPFEPGALIQEVERHTPVPVAG